VGTRLEKGDILQGSLNPRNGQDTETRMLWRAYDASGNRAGYI